jgi:TIR domain-containing protein
VQVFLSYRRSDVGAHAGRLADALGRRLGEQSVFQDVSAIARGERFAHAIEAALDGCDAVLAGHRTGLGHRIDSAG